MSFTQFLRGGALALVLGLVSGCTLVSGDTPAEDSTDTSSPAPPTAQATATLDWDNGTIHLPLEAYGMSVKDQQIVYAARYIAMVQCTLGTSVVPPEALPEARAWLDRTPPGQQGMRYGYWDANYLATQPLDPTDAVGTTSSGWTLDANKSKDCNSEDPTVLELVPISANGNPASEWELLWRDSNHANDNTIHSALFAQLRTERDQCITNAGYTLSDDEDYGGVAYAENATPEQQLAAMLVEATCADNMGFTQQVADLNASYEQDFINAHQGELVAIKKLADERTAKATTMLQDAGVM